MRWAEKMGLPNPRENASARQGWPKSSSWDEKESSFMQHAAPKIHESSSGYGSSYGSSYNGNYNEYGVGEQYYHSGEHIHSNQAMREGSYSQQEIRYPLSDVSGMEERRERSESMEFRQR